MENAIHRRPGCISSTLLAAGADAKDGTLSGFVEKTFGSKLSNSNN